MKPLYFNYYFLDYSSVLDIYRCRQAVVYYSGISSKDKEHRNVAIQTCSIINSFNSYLERHF
jgi:hypothetical protein